MRFLRRLAALFRIAGGARRNRTDLIRWMIRRPALFAAIQGYEIATLASNRVETRLKVLGSLKVSSMVGCPF